MQDIQAAAFLSFASTRPISLAPSTAAFERRAVRLLAMVSELHKAGYQFIRVSPGVAPGKMHWRCLITHAANIASDGWTIKATNLNSHEIACYASWQGDRYFGWRDCDGMSARQLAHRFLKTFPAIARLGSGRDWAYAGWLLEIISRAENGAVPILYSDTGILDSGYWMPPRSNGAE